MEGRGFRDLREEFDQLGAQIFGISFDDEAANAAFAQKFQFNFPLLCDTGRTVGLAYHACNAADAPMARRISYVIGPDGRVAHAYETVQPNVHPAQVLADLRAREGAPAS